MLMGILAFFLVSMIISQYYNALSKAELQKKRKAEYGSLQFTGKVIHYRVYRYMNKNYYQVCVKLDSARVKDIFIFNDDDCLKIKNGMATFSAGFLNHTLGSADSVAVNMNHSGKIELYYKKDNVLTKTDFGFDPMGLQKSDLNNCN